MREVAYWLYFQCVDFTIHLATLTGTTYRDANSFLFFLLWPAVTVLLWLWLTWNRWMIYRLRSLKPDHDLPEVPPGSHVLQRRAELG